MPRSSERSSWPPQARSTRRTSSTSSIVDADAAPSAVDIDRFAVVIEAMPTNLVSGTASVADGDVRLVGVVQGADARTALEQLGTNTGVVAELSDRPVADDAAARSLEDELNGFVATDPIRFEPGSTELTAEANAVLEQVASRALRLDGIDIVVVGHTDSDGAADDQPAVERGTRDASFVTHSSHSVSTTPR